MKTNNTPWEKIFLENSILAHNFGTSPYFISAKTINQSCNMFSKINQRKAGKLCKQDSRSDRPSIFQENNLFLLPTRNGHYAIIKGEGYIDVPEITSEPIIYSSKLDFELETSKIGSSEMQHLDFAYASSLIRTFMDDPTLVLTIRGRKYTPEFTFKVCGQTLDTASVQTEVDAGYEGKEQVVLIEAKNSSVSDTIIRQLYYPYKQWQTHTKKKVITLFFDMDHRNNIYSIWQFEFSDPDDYNSIKLVKSGRFKIE